MVVFNPKREGPRATETAPLAERFADDGYLATMNGYALRSTATARPPSRNIAGQQARHRADAVPSRR